MKSRTILVTGGAGYIGSHVVLRLLERGYRVVVVDDLSTGVRDSVRDAELVVGDVGDRTLIQYLLRNYRVDAVMHFAAKTVVPESVEKPLYYYRQNTSHTRNLLESCLAEGVHKFVFSSTAAVYGMPADGIAREDSPTEPINPYGSSKLMCEWMLRDTAAASALRYLTLRYFNVAGSDPEGRIGQSKEHCTLLTKVACEAAVGKRDSVTIFGTDYATEDGTGVRDYIHVDDIALAHIAALEYLDNDGPSATLNCGYGHGYSVRQVLDAMGRVHGIPLTIREAPRRAGDPPVLIADAQRIGEALGWRPQHDDLDFILKTALDWEYQLAGGRAVRPQSEPPGARPLGPDERPSA